MPENFRERADLTKIIKSILDSYPLGNGILRELLQNSDDASATKQTFILDMRTHPCESVVDQELIKCQGPALLAVNDTLFTESDWKAISTLHSSSKTTDETKIGKFGIGVRACYHITDNPHFLSGRKLAIFDPHERFSAGQEGGVRIDVITEGSAYPDQLAAFSNSLSPNSEGFFPGTVVRLPLRTPAQALESTIKATSVDQSVIEMLFHDFVQKELSVVMLFLKHIRSICLKVISPDGREHFIGSAEIPDLSIVEKRTFSRNTGAREETFKCAINLTSIDELHKTTTVSQVWRVCHAVRSTEQTSQIMSRHLGYNPSPSLSIFIQLSTERLFTLLPLPIHTEFPVHLHAILALTQDRQSLRNIEEIGTGSESRERLLVTWNRSIFDIFLPATWSALLRILVEETEIEDIWSAWPALHHANTSGSSYWSEILPNLMEDVLKLDLPIFPTFPNTNSHVSLSSSLLASEDDDAAILMALSKVGLSIVKPPAHIRQVLRLGRFSSKVALLHPESVRNALLSRIPELTKAAEEDKDRILQYLVLTPGTVCNVLGLPLVPLFNGSRVSLSQWSSTTRVLVTQQEGEVFRDCDDDLISLSRMSSTVAQAFCSPGAAQDLKVARLDKTKVHIYLHTLFGSFNPADDEVTDNTSSKAVWLTRFWKWMSESTWGDKSGLLPLITRFHLLPTAQGTLRKMEGRVILPIEGPTARRKMNAWEILGVHFLHPNVVPCSSAFRDFAVAPNDVPFLIDSISSQNIPVLDTQSASLIQNHLVQSLRDRSGVQLDAQKREKFLKLPIFPTRAAVVDQRAGDKLSKRGIGAVSGTLIYMRVDDYCPVPITPNDTTFFDITPNSGVLGTIIDPERIKKALDELGVLEMAVNYLKVQPPRVLDALLGRIIPRLSDLSVSAKSKLQSVPFVPVAGSQERVPPTQVIDPRSALASLYAGEAGKLPIGRWGEEPYLSLLSSQGFYQRELTVEIVEERINYLSRNWSQDEYPRIFDKARIFLRLLNDSWTSIQQVSRIAHHLTENWLPIRADTGLGAPEKCRDKGEKVYLFDLVLSVVDEEVRNQALRRYLGWNGIPMPVLLEQVQCALTHPQNRAHRLHALITECSRRSGTLSDQDLESLKRTVSHHPWVPIGRTEVVETQHALLRPSRLGGRFKIVPQSLLEAQSGQGAIFLRRMGCTGSPSLETLLTELNLLTAKRTSAREVVSEALEILKEMAPKLASRDYDSERVFLPGKDEVLHPIVQVYFVDSSTDFLPEGFPAHPEMSESLARDLGVQFLSSLELGGEDDDEDDLQMGEDFTIRVEGILKEHDVRYALNEFVANAVDAKASTFSVLLDERTFEWSKVVAPGIAELQRRPALLLYNNAKFSDADFRGLRKVGQGGKRSNPDSIGRYGLGALSLFHFTDVVQIVSNEHLLILDPSGTHLPPLKGRPRTALFRRLSDVFRRYPDQLSGFDSLFGFSKSASSYPGTIFRLPLRNASSPLSSTILRVSDCLNHLNGPYFGLAKDAMYFTCLERISADHQPPMGSSTSLWSVTGSRSSRDLNHDSEIVRLTSHHHPIKISQLWLVTKSITPISCVPAEHGIVLERMSLQESQIGLIVRMALLLEDSESAGLRTANQQTHSKFLFSSLRLPIQTSLSAHISAQFAISSDRRHIRFEPPDKSGHRIPEAAFNNWILDSLIPPLYISSIHDAANVAFSLTTKNHRVPRNAFAWWPVGNDDDDSISRAIVQSFYDSVPSSSVPICYTVTEELIAPTDAIFSAAGTPFEVQQLLQTLKSPIFVRPRYTILRLVTKVASAAGTDPLRFVDPSYLREFLEARALELSGLFKDKHSMVTISTIEVVLLFLLKGNVAVSGLPLLVLADGSLTYGNSQQPTKYVCKGPIPDIFPRSHFLHQRMKEETQLEDLLVQSPNMNVKLFDAAGVLALVTERIAPQSRCIHSPQARRWIADFWNIYTRLPGPPTATSLDPIPLISTASGDYISLEYCRRDDVIPEPLGRPAALVSAMQKMDLTFCRVPLPLRASFDKPFNLEAFLRAIGSKSSPFDSLSSNETLEVGQWIRLEVYTCTDNQSRSVVPSLPIWEARQNNRTLFLPACHLKMLPQGLRSHIFDGYTKSGIAIAEFSHALQTVLSWNRNYRTMDSQGLAQLLTFPDVLAPSILHSYSTLLTAFLRLGGEGTIPVPNGNLKLVEADQLYAHSVDLFSAALQSSERSLFLHPNFRHLHEQLRSKNLHFEVDWDAFLLCAQTVHADLTTRFLPESEIMQRAEVVYEFYNSRLPGIVMTNTNKWRQLSRLRFIPRDERRSPSSSYVTDSYCEDLPQIVAPSQILRTAYEQIAWSQRALCQVEPRSNLIALNASLGVPTAEEVVKHLSVLALQVAPEHPGNRTLLQQIRATYKWLNENSGDARGPLLRETGPLFLNVDDPDVEPWEWRPAEQLLFNIEYDYEDTKTFRVRRFLQDYRPLLLAAGAGSEDAVDYKPQAKPQDGNTLREAFSRMRSAGELTDVLLMPSNFIGEDIDVETLRAHSTFLAAAIPHVRAGLLGWREGNSEEYSFPGTYFGARAILDFIYTGKIERNPEETGKERMKFLRDLLELLRDADPWDMPELKDEIGRLVQEWKLLSRDTYWMLIDNAETYGAMSLLKYCQDWGRKNPASVATRSEYAEESDGESGSDEDEESI